MKAIVGKKLDRKKNISLGHHLMLFSNLVIAAVAIESEPIAPPYGG